MATASASSRASSTPEGESGPTAPAAEPEIAADDLRRMVRVLGLVEIPERLMAAVLADVREHRASMRRFERAGFDVSGVVTAQPYRA
jgi:hypothetical protein